MADIVVLFSDTNIDKIKVFRTYSRHFQSRLFKLCILRSYPQCERHHCPAADGYFGIQA
jgi:hypothetical protein